jgi:anti-sigma regulatory factor (Ser/Thr protein kinase)
LAGASAVDRVPLELAFPATMAGFEAGFARLRDALDREDLDAGARYKAELVFEEMVANIVRYARPDGPAAQVRVSVARQDGALVLTFEDDGVPFDPRAQPEPVPATSLEAARIGGLGLMMVRRAARSMDYVRTPEQRNRTSVTLATPGAPAT